MSEIFTALQRESALIAEEMCYGATLISKANYARQGRYLQLFFSLSIAFERAAKLIIVTDHMIATGTKPEEAVYRKYGHDLIGLLERVKEISDKLDIQDYGEMPDTPIHHAIINILSDFAKNITRYYNLDIITKKNKNTNEEPISQWYHNVILPLFEKCVSKQRKETISLNASVTSVLMEKIASVQHTNETGDTIDHILEASYQTGLLEATAPYTRLHVLQICRYLGAVLSELGYIAMNKQIEDMPYLSDFFRVFYNEDSYFKKRKIWEIL